MGMYERERKVPGNGQCKIRVTRMKVDNENTVFEWYENNRKEKEMLGMMIEEKEKKLFIAHSSDDAEYVEAFVELLEDLGMKEQEIVCSSIPPYCVPLDNGVYEWLVSQFQHCDLHVVYFLSENYYSSVASMNEMGAAWAMKHKWTAMLMPGFPFDKVRGCIDKTKIGIKLDDIDKRTLNYRLIELKNNLIKEFNLSEVSESRWERKRDSFLNEIAKIASNRSLENEAMK